MFKFIERLFNGSNEHEIKKMRRVVEEQINPLEASLKNLSDSSLAHKTVEFKNRLANGETLDDILPEAFAVIREASAVFSVCVSMMYSLSGVWFFTVATLPKCVLVKVRRWSL